MSEFITISDGRVLSARIADYEKSRESSEDRGSTIRAVCNAPFVSLDFSPLGDVGLCNHIFKQVTRITPDSGVLEVWRGERMADLRRSFSGYCLDSGCVHCIHQIETGHYRETFAQEHFDVHPVTSMDPAYPQRLIFRMNSTCNLACIMCDGATSSRVRKERDGLPPLPSAYGEKFFRDMEEILPHVKKVPYDALADFTHLALVNNITFMLVVNKGDILNWFCRHWEAENRKFPRRSWSRFNPLSTT